MAANIPRELPVSKKITCPSSEMDILLGAEEAWEQYKKDMGTRVASTKELNTLLDSL